MAAYRASLGVPLCSYPGWQHAVDYYRIDKHRLAVTLTLAGGGCLRGHIFVQPAVYGLPEGDNPLRELKGAEPFFPVQADDGDVILVAKERVVEVWGPTLHTPDELRRQSARCMHLEVRLATGVVRCGSVVVEMPSNRARPLDFLNQHHQRFLTLYDNEGVRLLNMRQIDSVRPLG